MWRRFTTCLSTAWTWLIWTPLREQDFFQLSDRPDEACIQAFYIAVRPQQNRFGFGSYQCGKTYRFSQSACRSQLLFIDVSTPIKKLPLRRPKKETLITRSNSKSSCYLYWETWKKRQLTKVQLKETCRKDTSPNGSLCCEKKNHNISALRGSKLTTTLWWGAFLITISAFTCTF